LVFNCFADALPRFSEYPPVERPCPEQRASFLSKLFFSWFDALAWKGFRKPLEVKDLWNMNPEDTAREIVPVFDKHWNETLHKASNVPSPKASFRKRSGNVDFVGGRQRKKCQASILPALCKTFGPTFVFGSLLKLVQDVLTFVQPQLLKLLISFVENKEELWKGYFYAALMFAAASVQTLVLAQYFNRMLFIGLRIRTALISAIYRKALRMSNTARKESTVGEIVNLMSVDAQRFTDLTTYLNMIWSAPLQIALALYFLWETLGPSVLAGLAVMIILIPVNGVIANRMKTLQIKQMKYKDERVRLMNEVLNGIKVLKLYAWEPSFEQQILKIRNKEIVVLKQAAYLNASTSFLWSCAPFLVSLVTFATFVLSDPNNILDSKTAFVSLSLFNILRFPLAMLPMLISSMVQNANETWYTETPRLSPCFQKTVLVWTPCLFLWVFAPLETYYILHSKTRNIPWNWLNISKLVVTAVLVILAAADLGHSIAQSASDGDVSSADFYSPIIKIATFSLSGVFVTYNRIHGQRASGLLFLFWCFLALCGAVQYHHELTDVDSEQEDRVSVC